MNVPQVSKKTLNLRGSLLSLDVPVAMGILNITPDSFHADSRFRPDSEEVVQKAGQMLAAGAAILDVGGYSTRPGAAELSVAEELDRVGPVIEALVRHFPDAPISIDTFRAAVARESVRAGACMVNDVSGGNLDGDMFRSVAEMGVPYVLMHMRGTPRTMTQLTNYNDLVGEIISELSRKLLILRKLGAADVVIDPGFGFAKNVSQNFELLDALDLFHELNAPLLVGLSRKSMIWRTLGITPEEALNGTTVLNTLALQKGVKILRVHDVKEAVEAIELWRRTAGKKGKNGIFAPN